MTLGITWLFSYLGICVWKEFKIHYYLAKTLMIFCQRRTYFPEKSVLWPINLALYAEYGKWAFICTPEP